jgi:hypothetical protein
MPESLYIVELLSASGRPIVREAFDCPALANFRIGQLLRAGLPFAAWNMTDEGFEPNRVRPVFLS